MKTVELSSDKNRCIWCGKHSDAPHQLTIETKKQRYIGCVCSGEHEQSVQRAYWQIQRRLPFFIAGMVVAVAMIFLGGGSNVTWFGLFALGLSIIACPCVTPQTIELLGMKKSFVIARVAGLMQCGFAIMMLTTGCGKGNPQAEAAATEVALTWLQGIDEGKYSESWTQAASHFQKSVPNEHWGASLKRVREPMGKNQSRKVSSVDYTTNLPGSPKGEYVVIQFKSDFETKKGAVETVTPMLDNGTWKVSGYYIK